MQESTCTAGTRAMVCLCFLQEQCSGPASTSTTAGWRAVVVPSCWHVQLASEPSHAFPLLSAEVVWLKLMSTGDMHRHHGENGLHSVLIKKIFPYCTFPQYPTLITNLLCRTDYHTNSIPSSSQIGLQLRISIKCNVI